MWSATRTATDGDALEEQATALLKEIGAFRQGTGIRSPRSEAEARWKTLTYEPWHEAESPDWGSVELWDEMDAVAEGCRLSPDEKTVLSMWRLDEYSYREIARELRVTVYWVRVLLARALQKVEAHRAEPPVSASALFYEEIRQKRASIYRAPYSRRRRARPPRRVER